MLQIRRFARDGEPVRDMISDELQGPPPEPASLIDPLDPTRRREIPAGSSSADLLVPVLRGGRMVCDRPPLAALRERARVELQRFRPGVRRFVNPHQFPVGLERRLHDLRTRLVLEARGLAPDA